jgi:hypothetical protein
MLKDFKLESSHLVLKIKVIKKVLIMFIFTYLHFRDIKYIKNGILCDLWKAILNVVFAWLGWSGRLVHVRTAQAARSHPHRGGCQRERGRGGEPLLMAQEAQHDLHRQPCRSRQGTIDIIYTRPSVKCCITAPAPASASDPTK